MSPSISPDRHLGPGAAPHDVRQHVESYHYAPLLPAVSIRDPALPVLRSSSPDAAGGGVHLLGLLVGLRAQPGSLLRRRTRKDALLAFSYRTPILLVNF